MLVVDDCKGSDRNWAQSEASVVNESNNHLHVVHEPEATVEWPDWKRHTDVEMISLKGADGVNECRAIKQAKEMEPVKPNSLGSGSMMNTEH